MGREHKGCESCLGYLVCGQGIFDSRSIDLCGAFVSGATGARAIEILDEEINEFSVIIPLFFFLTLRS